MNEEWQLDYKYLTGVFQDIMTKPARLRLARGKKALGLKECVHFYSELNAS